MGEEELITQLGLLLTQTRFARRALEDIERATSVYATFTFTSVIAAGPKFGEPPMFDGALRVHVVNISDLAPGAGFGNFLEGLLGGVGRFVGNVAGGFVGGTVGTLSLIGSIPTIQDIAVRVERILGMLGTGTPTPTTPSTTDGRGEPVGGTNLIAQLAAIKTAVDGLTGLFLAAGGETEKAAATSNLPNTPQGAAWLRTVDSATVALSATARLVNGLIIALPLVIGSVSWLISRLGDLRLGIAETLRFVLRNTLLLRGALLVTAFDSLAMVARMASTVIGILQSTVDGMISAIFDTVREALLAVFDLGAVLGEAVQKTVNELLNWLVPTIDTVLRNLADLRVFRVITHIIRVLPAILPPIYELVTDKQMAAERPVEFGLLQKAAELPFLAPVTPVTPAAPGTPGAAKPLKPPPMPDFRVILGDPKLTGKATGALDRMQQVTSDGLRIVVDNAQTGLRTLGTRLDTAAAEEAKLSDTRLGQHLTTVRTQSTALAENLVVGEKVRPETGLEAIATAYEGWLTKGGLDTLLKRITDHFSSKEGQAGIPDQIAQSGMVRPRATVQIDEVVIEIDGGPAGVEVRPSVPATAPAPMLGPGDFPLPAEGDDIERHARMWFDYDQRGGGSRLPFPL